MAGYSASELRRLRWRCRRGIRELDLLLERYMEERFANAPRADQQAFEALLEAPDPVIYALCLGQEDAPDPKLGALIGRITAAALPR